MWHFSGILSPSSGPGILRAEFSHTVAFLAGWLVGRKKQQEVVVVVTTAGVGVGGWRMCGGDEGGGRRVVGAGVWMRAFWFGGMTGGSVVLVLALVAVVAAAGVVFCCCCHVCHSQLRGGAGGSDVQLRKGTNSLVFTVMLHLRLRCAVAVETRGSSKCYSLLEKHTTVVVTTVSASAQSCFRRAQKGAMSSRGAAAVVRIRLSGQKPAFRVGFCTLVFLRHLPWSGKGGKGDLALREVCGIHPYAPA